MAVINPDHLLDQARVLARVPAAGAPRQADLRRAISSCYYAVFHHTLTAAADMFVGNTNRSSPEYALAYRAIGHKALRDLCVDLQKVAVPERYSGSRSCSGLWRGLSGVCRWSCWLAARQALGRLRSLDQARGI